MSGPLRLGIIGAGSVCEHYLPKLACYPDVDVRIIGDRHPERSAARAEQFGIPAAGTGHDVLATEAVEAVLNLTPPASHLSTSLDVIDSGRHLYSEKPLAMTSRDAREIAEAAHQRGVVVGSAPDIMLAPGFQAGLRALADRQIGEPVFARAEAVLAGPERWHPRPEFLYAKGGGPLFDIGPYYLTALVATLGSITAVAARGTRKSRTRTIGSGPDAGHEFPVEVPSLVSALLEFESGITGTLLLTFDSASHRGGSMEVLGTSGTLRLPDPNGADSDPAVLAGHSETWGSLPWDGRFDALGPGLVNFARHLRGNEPLIADGTRAAHVVDVMEAVTRSIESGDRHIVTSRTSAATLLPRDWNPAAATL